MSYQIPKNNRPPKQELYTGLHKIHNLLDVSMTSTENLVILILISIILVLVLSKAKKVNKIFELVLIFMKKKHHHQITKAKLLLPVRLPVLDSIYTMIKFRKDGIQFLEYLTEQFGNLFEIPFGPFTFTVVSDPEIIQKILSSQQLVYQNRPKMYHSIFGEIFHEGLVTSENEIWSVQRKMLSRSFTYKSLRTYVKFMNTHALNLTKRLIQENDSGLKIGTQCINKLLYCHSFKIIAQIVMGTDSLTPEESNDVAYYFDCCKDLVSDRLLNPWKYLWCFPKRRELNQVNKYLNNFCVKVTQKYKNEYLQTKITSSANNLQHLGTLHDNEDENFGVKPFRCMIEEMLCCGASDKEIYQQVGTILGTGHETTVVAIRMLMLHLALNPEHQTACREEIDKVINRKGKNFNNTCDHISDIDSIDLTMEDLNDLKYLERCILESGRLTSVVPLFLRRIDAPLKIYDELEFPAGTNFAIANWMLHRNSQIYPDSLKFDPDRFLAENVKKRHPYSYTAFSLGPRNCIGWKVATMQIKVIMTYIIRNFGIFSDDKLENVKLHFGLTIVPERDYKITLERRKHSHE